MPPDFPGAIWRPSPNKEPRPSNAGIDTVVLHATGGALEPSLNWLAKPGSGVSAHYVVAKDGRIFQLVEERNRAWHAGVSRMPPPDNREDVNDFSVGIELENANTGQDPYPPAQIEALVQLLKHLIRRYNIPRRNIVTHREIAVPPGRKSDPLGLDVKSLLDRVYGELERETTRVGTLIVNRPLVGLHARNDVTFTETDYRVIAEARIESLKMLSITAPEVYRRCREINPNVEFIVRLYKHMPVDPRTVRPPRPAFGPVSPQAFADEFRDIINRLYETFGVVKFEIHNEPNHKDGVEGWGQEEAFASEFNEWYKRVFAILKERHPFALFGFPGLAIPHNDKQWLDWCREAIEMSDWLGCHVYWQTPPHAPETYKSDEWGLRFKYYHAKYPHKLIEITEYGNSNGQSGYPLPPEEQARQYVWWLRHLQQYPYIGSAHAFIASSPDPQWVHDLFTWADDRAGRLFPVVQAVGRLVPRPSVPPEWGVVWEGFRPPVPVRAGTDFVVTGRVINAGRRPWRQNGPNRVILILRWLTADGQRRVGDPLYLSLPHDLAPSEGARLSLKVVAPAEPGEYLLRFDVYDVGSRKYTTTYGTVPLVYRLSVQPREPERPLLLAEWGAFQVPDRMAAGERVPITVTVTNAGRAAWRAGGEPPKGVVHLGYHWLTPDGRALEGATRGVLPHDVAPGQTVTLRDVEIVPPEEPGTYTLRLDMVSELVAWFHQVGGRPLLVEVTVEPARPALAFEWVRVELPDRMTAGKTVTGRVTVRNTGRETWVAQRPDGRGIVRLGYHWYTPEGESVTGWADLRTPLPHDVPPGQEVTLDPVEVAAPTNPGQYRLELNLVKEGVAWFPLPPDSAGSFLVNVVPAEVPEPEVRYGVEYVAHTVPSTVQADSTYTVAITLRNTGSFAWKPDGEAPVHLAHHWIAPDGHVAGWWDAFRTRLPRAVPPGETVRVEGIVVRAPEKPGAYTLRWDLVQEGVAWFSDRGAPALEVSVTVVTRPEWAVEWLDHETPTTLTAGATMRVGVHARNTGRKGWPKGGRHPVRVGYHWYDPEGRPVEVDDLRTELPHPVKVGDDVRLMAALAVPARPGEYRLEWDLVRGDDQWFKDLGSAPLGISVRVEPPAERPWRVRASHNAEQAALAVDGNPDTFWDSLEVQAPGMWFEVDLGAEQVLDGVRFLSPGRGYPVGYRILVSRDGENWVTVADRPQNWRDAVAAFDARPVRFVRIEQTGTPSYRATWRIAEVEVDEAPAWQATASHNPEEAHLAVDRDPATAWSSQARQEPGMWFEVDMGKERVIEAIEVHSPGRGYAVGYRLFISTDRQTWVLVDERPRNWKDIEATFAPVPVRYIRIEQTGRPSYNAPWLISEIATRPAVPWRATASHNAHLAANALDNRPDTAWTTGQPQEPGMWFMVDFRQVLTLDGLILDHGKRPDYPRGVRVQTSYDGETWRTVHEAAENEGGLDVTFDRPVAARYLAVRQTGRADRPWTIARFIVKRA